MQTEAKARLRETILETIRTLREGPARRVPVLAAELRLLGAIDALRALENAKQAAGMARAATAIGNELEEQEHEAAFAGFVELLEDLAGDLVPEGMVRRDELEAGDVFQSSHGFKVHVERVLTQGDTTAIHGRMHRPDGPAHVERYPRGSLVELVEPTVVLPEPAPEPAPSSRSCEREVLRAELEELRRTYAETPGRRIAERVRLAREITEREHELDTFDRRRALEILRGGAR